MTGTVLLAATALVTGLSCAAQAPQPQGPQPQAPACTAREVRFRTDGRDGDFNGMSHGGTLLVLRNTGRRPCRIEHFPEIAFFDNRKPLRTAGSAESATYMHPGPVVFPVVLQPGSVATAKVLWISGEVYDRNFCVSANRVTVRLGQAMKSAAGGGHICGKGADGPATFTYTGWALDPAYKPS